MRVTSIAIACVVLASPALAATITTQHFNTWAEVQQVVVGGMEWTARGDTEQLSLTPTDAPPSRVAVDYDLWSSGFETAFTVVYNAPGSPIGITVDDVQAIYESPQPPILVDEETNGLLVTAFAAGAGRTIELHNLKITLPGFQMYDVGDIAYAPDTDYMLIETDLPLTDGFILSGQAVMSWTGPLAPSAEHWFEVTPVVTPEPGSGLLLVGGLLLGVIRRR
jgi:hypothetical protein